MAKKQTNSPFMVGAQVRAREGVTAPEFPDVPCSGWTGSIVEVSGARTAPRFLVEWDPHTLEAMPAAYRQKCEERQLLFSMACLTADQIEPAD